MAGGTDEAEEGGCADVAVGVAELGVVEGVEEFGAELEGLLLVDGKVLVDADVVIMDAGTVEGSPGRIAEEGGGGGGKAGSVKEAAAVVAEIAGEAGGSAGAGPVGAVGYEG